VSDETPSPAGGPEPGPTDHERMPPELPPDDRAPVGAGTAPAGDGIPLPSGSARVFASTIDVVVAGLLLGLADSVLFVLFVGPVKDGKLTSHQASVSLLISLLVLLAGAFLWVFLERTGGSIGKRFAGLRTTTMTGTYPAPVSQLALKYLLMFALLVVGYYGTLIVLVGLLVPFWQKQRRNAFDLVGRVRAIPKSAVTVVEPQSSGAPSAPGPSED
jgi:uncharacterized RDD family membrane protein YckC